MSKICPGVRGKMCVKPVSEDELISGYIRTAGCWEPEIVNSVIRAVTTFPGAAFLGGISSFQSGG